jgi:hypothetical protein
VSEAYFDAAPLVAEMAEADFVTAGRLCTHANGVRAPTSMQRSVEPSLHTLEPPPK